MDSIKKKMEKLANETAEAECRIANYESIKAANEAEAEKYEEQLREASNNTLLYFFCNFPHVLLLSSNYTTSPYYHCSPLTFKSFNFLLIFRSTN